MFHLAGADAMSQARKSTVGRGVRISAHNRHARQRRALLRSNDVNDALAMVVHLELHDGVLVAIGVQGVYLELGDGIGDSAAAIGGGHIVIRNRQVGIDTPGFAIRSLESFEGLRRRHLVEQVAVNVEDRGAVVVPAHLVTVPEFVVKRLAGHRCSPLSRKEADCNGRWGPPGIPPWAAGGAFRLTGPRRGKLALL